jgi:hypothetical protein
MTDLIQGVILPINTVGSGVALRSLMYRVLPAFLFVLLWTLQSSYAATCDDQTSSVNQLKSQIDELGQAMNAEVECSVKEVSLSKQRLKAFKTLIVMEDKLVKSCPQFTVNAAGRKLNAYTMTVLAKEPAKCAKITPVITPNCTRALAKEHYNEYYRLVGEAEKLFPLLNTEGPHKDYCIGLYKNTKADVATFDYVKANNGCIEDREEVVDLQRTQAKQDFNRRDLSDLARECNPDVKLDWFSLERHW